VVAVTCLIELQLPSGPTTVDIDPRLLPDDPDHGHNGNGNGEHYPT
jgi:hypothetical protein